MHFLKRVFKLLIFSTFHTVLRLANVLKAPT